MVAPDRIQDLYEELADRSERRGDARQRDIFLVLAADAALANGRTDQAERLRQKLLDLSPHNLLRPFASLSEAMHSSDIREYVNDLRLQFPPEKAEKMLDPGASSKPANENPFGQEVYQMQDTLQSPSPASPFLAGTVAPPPPPIPPARAKRRSPYENPDYGPRVPAGAAPKEFTGHWIIFLLIALVLLFGVALLGYVLGQPLLK